MKAGLVTLADVPALGPERAPRSTIVVARLDDKLYDPRYGRFGISQADVDGWQRNLADTFGGRVSIDFDHSSDRGGGTKAAGWITGIGQQGRNVTADVEWTPRGAKAIRDGEYRMISPTFVPDFVDEHKESHGRALLGAALTNRPVLRRGMPCLSLSRDTFDGVAVPRRKTKNGRKAMSTKTTPKTLSPKAAKAADKAWRRDPAAYAAAVRAQGASPDLTVTLARCAPDVLQKLKPELSLDAVMTLAQFAPPGVQHAGTVDWQPPATGADRVPPGLDDAGRALHALIAARAASTGKHYFHAMSDVTGIPAYRELSDIPPALGQQQGLDPVQAAKYATGRALATSHGIGWMDAMNYLDHVGALGELQRDDGSAPADTPWLDTRPLASPPRPWSEDDWNRDKRRAAAAGIQIGALGPDGQDTQLKGMWTAGAEQGRDVVGEMAAQQRADAIADLEAQGDGLLDQARANEDSRRFNAINDELIRRARNRVAGSAA